MTARAIALAQAAPHPEFNAFFICHNTVRVLRNLSSKGNLPSFRGPKKKSPIIFVPKSETKLQDWYMKHDGSI